MNDFLPETVFGENVDLGTPSLFIDFLPSAGFFKVFVCIFLETSRAEDIWLSKPYNFLEATDCLGKALLVYCGELKLYFITEARLVLEFERGDLTMLFLLFPVGFA